MSNFQKNSKDYGEPYITYQLAGCADKRGIEGKVIMGRCSRWDRYLGMTAVMTQVPVPTAMTAPSVLTTQQ